LTDAGVYSGIAFEATLGFIKFDANPLMYFKDWYKDLQTMAQVQLLPLVHPTTGDRHNILWLFMMDAADRHAEPSPQPNDAAMQARYKELNKLVYTLLVSMFKDLWPQVDVQQICGPKSMDIGMFKDLGYQGLPSRTEHGRRTLERAPQLMGHMVPHRLEPGAPQHPASSAHQHLPS
jgi:hypothetical protein